jgi:hypothetical protein
MPPYLERWRKFVIRHAVLGVQVLRSYGIQISAGQGKTLKDGDRDESPDAAQIVFATENGAFEDEQDKLVGKRCERVSDDVFLLVAVALQLQPLGRMFFVLGLRVVSKCAAMGVVGTYRHCFGRMCRFGLKVWSEQASFG